LSRYNSGWFCHSFFNKTPYELLIGRKPNISYFRVFGYTWYILKNGTRLSKFQSKCDEGFVLRYSCCSKAYQVYNKSIGAVEEICDVQFDETNGSHEEQENLDDMWSDGLRNAVKNMSIGDIRLMWTYLPLIQPHLWDNKDNKVA
jgi:hypothetical protein